MWTFKAKVILLEFYEIFLFYQLSEKAARELILCLILARSLLKKNPWVMSKRDHIKFSINAIYAAILKKNGNF